MRQSEVFPKYREYSKDLDSFYRSLQQLYEPNGISELLKLRGYVTDDSLYDFYTNLGVGMCNVEGIIDKDDVNPELNLFSEDGFFLLNNRFIIPVEDMVGNISTLIGYYPDYKKYITIPTPFFSKECMFFNFKQAYELSWSKYDGFVILVEGIFDCLSLRSIGLPAIATMGATVSKLKGELLKLFRKVLAIPDDDATGRKALNRYSRWGWKVPSNTTMLKFRGGGVVFNGVTLHCKDMDNFVTWFEKDDVIEILLSYRDSKEDVEELIL